MQQYRKWQNEYCNYTESVCLYLGQAEVCDFEVVQLLPAQDVFWLEVAVNDAEVVQIRHGLEQRSNQTRAIGLAKSVKTS